MCQKEWSVHMTTWNLEGMKKHVLMCNGSSCMRKGGEEVTVAIRDEIKTLGLDEHVHTSRTRCNGRCKDACVVVVYPEGAWYEGMTPDKARLMVQSHLRDNVPLQDSLVYQFEEGQLARTSHTEAIKGIQKNKDEKKESVKL